MCHMHSDEKHLQGICYKLLHHKASVWILNRKFPSIKSWQWLLFAYHSTLYWPLKSCFPYTHPFSVGSKWSKMISVINEGIRHQNSCQWDEQKWGVSFLGHLVCLSLLLSPICYRQDSELLVGLVLKVAGSPLAWIPEWLHGPELPHHYWLDFSWQGNKLLLIIKPQVWSKGPCPLCYIFLFLANRGGISLNCGQGAVVGKRMSLLDYHRG